MRDLPDDRSRRTFLRLLGATGAATGGIGSVGATSEEAGESFAADLSAAVPDRCLGGTCSDVEHVLPVGSEVSFETTVTGAQAGALSSVLDPETGERDLIDACWGSANGCETFTVGFDEVGNYHVQYHALEASPATDVSEDISKDALPVTPASVPSTDCSELAYIGCDTVSVSVVDPSVELEVRTLGGEGPIRTADTLVIEAALDPVLDADTWDLETSGVPTERAATPDRSTPPGVVHWGYRPLGPGDLEITATAEIGDTTVSETVTIPVESVSELTIGGSTLAVDGSELSGRLAVTNDTDEDRSIEVALATRSGIEQTTVQEEELTLLAGERGSIELSGALSSDADTALLLLGRELLARTALEESG
jgi:hypothetical protein